jgi:hypothetical protein
LKDLGVDGNIILIWIIKNNVRGCGFGSSASGYGLVVDSCEHGNDFSGSIKGGKFLEHDCLLGYC